MSTAADSSMVIPILLMSIAAPIGAVDVAYYHLWRFRLYERPSSRAETRTHLLRGAIFASVAWLISSYQLSGAWFWIASALLLLDFLNNAVDTALEPASRADLGGVPRAEHVVHIVGSTLAGAFTALYFVYGWPLALEPTALVSSAGALPPWLAFQGRATAVGGGLLTLLELALYLRASRKPR